MTVVIFQNNLKWQKIQYLLAGFFYKWTEQEYIVHRDEIILGSIFKVCDN